MSENALPIDTTVREYRINAHLGEGGFGLTYKASHAHLDGEFAIKEFFPAGIAKRTMTGGVTARSNQEAADVFQWGLEKFVSEAQTLSRLEHPAIVKVKDVFVDHGSGFMIMEFIDGETLEDRIERGGPMAVEDVRKMVLQLCDGLEAVHQAGFLHRDIKPSNVMIRRVNGAFVLIDFGASRSTTSGKATTTRLKSHGYSPLELTLAQMGTGPWSDIYSLAAIAYYALTGHEPPDAQQQRFEAKPDPIAKLANTNTKEAKFLSALDHALALRPKDRPQSIANWRKSFEAAAAPVSQAANDEASAGGPRAILTGALAASLFAALLLLYFSLPPASEEKLSVGIPLAIAQIGIMSVLMGCISAAFDHLLFKRKNLVSGQPVNPLLWRYGLNLVAVFVTAGLFYVLSSIALIIASYEKFGLLYDFWKFPSNGNDSSAKFNISETFATLAFVGLAISAPISHMILRWRAPSQPLHKPMTAQQAALGFMAVLGIFSAGFAWISSGALQKNEMITKLAQLGYFPGDLPEEINEIDQKAIREFQTAEDIPVTGELDRRTVAQLRKKDAKEEWYIQASKGQGRRELEAAIFYCQKNCVIKIGSGRYDLASKTVFEEASDATEAAENPSEKSTEAKGIIVKGSEAEPSTGPESPDPMNSLTETNASGYIDDLTQPEKPKLIRIVWDGQGSRPVFVSRSRLSISGQDNVTIEGIDVLGGLAISGQSPPDDEKDDVPPTTQVLKNVNISCDFGPPRKFLDTNEALRITSGISSIRIENSKINVTPREDNCQTGIFVTLGLDYKGSETLPIKPQGKIEIVNPVIAGTGKAVPIHVSSFLEESTEITRLPVDPLVVDIEGGRLSAATDRFNLYTNGNSFVRVKGVTMVGPDGVSGVFLKSKLMLNNVTGACVAAFDDSVVEINGGNVRSCSNSAIISNGKSKITVRGIPNAADYFSKNSPTSSITARP